MIKKLRAKVDALEYELSQAIGVEMIDNIRAQLNEAKHERDHYEDALDVEVEKDCSTASDILDKVQEDSRNSMYTQANRRDLLIEYIANALGAVREETVAAMDDMHDLQPFMTEAQKIADLDIGNMSVRDIASKLKAAHAKEKA